MAAPIFDISIGQFIRRFRMSWKIVVLAGLILLSSDLMAKKPDGHMVPFHGVFVGYVTGFDPVEGDRCNNSPEGKAAWAVASFVGWGEATHMGWTYMEASHCSYLPIDGDGNPVGDPDGTYGEGHLMLTADNGDMLLATYDDGISTSPPPLIGFKEHLTFIDGGTGRFTFASGNGIDIGTFDPVEGIITIQTVAEIRYSKK
jgi:hypothetical protein